MAAYAPGCHRNLFIVTRTNGCPPNNYISPLAFIMVAFAMAVGPLK